MQSDSHKTILITGANRGIGLSILKRLVTKFPEHTYLLACRSADAGQSAISELRKNEFMRSNHRVHVVVLDVGSLESIESAAKQIERVLGGKIDVLVNNAGVAYILPSNPDKPDLEGMRKDWEKTFQVNVYAPFLLFTRFLPFLLKSSAPRVINISSGRASLSRSSGGQLPPTAAVSYSVSKVALNGLGVEMEKSLAVASEGKGRVWNVNPGHCKTEFNGYRGTRDPMDGAGVVEVLLQHDNKNEPVDSGFWEEEKGVLARVPW